MNQHQPYVLGISVNHQARELTLAAAEYRLATEVPQRSIAETAAAVVAPAVRFVHVLSARLLSGDVQRRSA